MATCTHTQAVCPALAVAKGYRKPRKLYTQRSPGQLPDMARRPLLAQAPGLWAPRSMSVTCLRGSQFYCFMILFQKSLALKVIKYRI